VAWWAIEVRLGQGRIVALHSRITLLRGDLLLRSLLAVPASPHTMGDSCDDM
jgi:hypothetical protein